MLVFSMLRLTNSILKDIDNLKECFDSDVLRVSLTVFHPKILVILSFTYMDKHLGYKRL